MTPGFFVGTEMPDGEWWQALWPEPAKVLTTCGLLPDVTGIDLCAGDGWFTVPMAQIARRVIAIDIDAKLLQLARLRVERASLTNCEFKNADAYELDQVVSKPVEFVFLANAFHGVPEQTRLSSKVASVLAPDGRFAIVNWHRRPREETTVLGEPRGPKTELRMTPKAVEAVVKPSGLAPLCVVEIPPYHYGSIFEKAALR